MARSRTAAGSFLRSSWIRGPLAAIFAVTLAGVVAGDPPSGNDLFTGRVEHGTGAFRTALGTVLITISLGDSTRASRPLTLTFAGTPCAPGGTACIVLDGVAHGRATPQGSIPDTGEIL